MPKGKTKHHCPGQRGWVGDASPGNCMPADDGSHCTKHQVPCDNGCGNYRLRSQETCWACEGKMLADERRHRAQTLEAIQETIEDPEDTFFHPPKERKKPKTKKKHQQQQQQQQ